MTQEIDVELRAKILETLKKVHVEGMTPEELTKAYDDWAEKYDEDLSPNLYKAPEYVANALAEQCDISKRKSMMILDVAAGTGRVGITLNRLGFQNIDALEPSEKMLEILRKHGIYGKIWKDRMGFQQTEIEENSYDAVVSSGGLGRQHMPVNSINEMLRIARSGGFIVVIIREAYLTTTEEFSKLEPLFNKLEGENKIKKIERRVVPNYMFETKAVVYIYEVV